MKHVERKECLPHYNEIFERNKKIITIEEEIENMHKLCYNCGTQLMGNERDWGYCHLCYKHRIMI